MADVRRIRLASSYITTKTVAIQANLWSLASSECPACEEQGSMFLDALLDVAKTHRLTIRPEYSVGDRTDAFNFFSGHHLRDSQNISPKKRSDDKSVSWQMLKQGRHQILVKKIEENGYRCTHLSLTLKSSMLGPTAGSAFSDILGRFCHDTEYGPLPSGIMPDEWTDNLLASPKHQYRKGERIVPFLSITAGKGFRVVDCRLAQDDYREPHSEERLVPLTYELRSGKFSPFLGVVGMGWFDMAKEGFIRQFETTWPADRPSLSHLECLLLGNLGLSENGMSGLVSSSAPEIINEIAFDFLSFPSNRER